MMRPTSPTHPTWKGLKGFLPVQGTFRPRAWTSRPRRCRHGLMITLASDKPERDLDLGPGKASSAFADMKNAQESYMDDARQEPAQEQMHEPEKVAGHRGATCLVHQHQLLRLVCLV